MAGGSPTLPLTPSGPLFDYSLKWMSGLDILVRDRGGLLHSRRSKVTSHPCTDCATSSAITNRKTWGQTNQEILGQTCGRARSRGRSGCLHSERRVGSNETDSRSWEYRSVSSCHAREGRSERAPFCASVECMHQASRRGGEESGILFTMLFAFGGSMVHNVAESITGSGGLSPVRYQKREGST
jgi:hypothetical protein